MAILLIFWGAVFTSIFFLLSLIFKTVSSILTNGINTMTLTFTGILSTGGVIFLVYLIYDAALTFLTKSLFDACLQVALILFVLGIILGIILGTGGLIFQMVRLIVLVIVNVIVLALEFLYTICYEICLYCLNVIITSLDRC